jgi:hypothetical protein
MLKYLGSSKFLLGWALAGGLIFSSNASATFTGYFDVTSGNWVFSQTPGDNGSVDTSLAPDSILLIGSDTNPPVATPPVCTCGIEDYTITIPYDGLISFDWSYSSVDTPGYDVGYFLLNGIPFFLSDTDGDSGSILGIPVLTGDVFGFGVDTGDNYGGPGLLTISNFSEVPEPATFALMSTALIGFILVRKKR